MWRNIVGINPDEESPGYKHFVIEPQIGGGLTWARGTYNSVRGSISSEWELNGSRLSLYVSIPPNTTATICIPASESSEVLERGRPARTMRGIRAMGWQNGVAKFEVGSGNYEFVAEISPQSARGN